ncbi:hypothetical protein [Acidiferrobacter sp.]|uniref:hypothetical protein n=1 Tax=Acidiferrobacter sp. TaxID=1872107 RepID=UPI0026320E3F|nr:hypothetical protein [Acidiferrobacter sp.]
MLDTLNYAKRLRAAGFTEQQAEAQAGALYDAVTGLTATKLDVVESSNDINAAMTRAFGDVRREIAEFKEATAREFDDVRREIADIWQALQALGGQISLLRWMVGFNLALTTAVLVKLLA